MLLPCHNPQLMPEPECTRITTEHVIRCSTGRPPTNAEQGDKLLEELREVYRLRHRGKTADADAKLRQIDWTSPTDGDYHTRRTVLSICMLSLTVLYLTVLSITMLSHCLSLSHCVSLPVSRSLYCALSHCLSLTVSLSLSLSHCALSQCVSLTVSLCLSLFITVLSLTASLSL
jgi:hypothetical protein